MTTRFDKELAAHRKALVDGSKVTGTLPIEDHHRLASILSDIANSDGVDFPSQEELAHHVAQLVRTMPYGDYCDRCALDQHATDGPYSDPTRYPVSISIEGDWMIASYRCHVCDTRWTCGWSVGAPWMM